MSGKYFSEKTSGNVTGKTDVHDLVANPGNTTVNNTFVGFPSYVNTNNTWEQPTELGYKILNNGVYVDIANSIKAKYVDYNYSSTTKSITVPAWCNKLKIIAISGGGGGGGGGANDNDGNRAGAGASGAGGMLSIMTTKENYNPANKDFYVAFGGNAAGGSGLGGAYEEDAGQSGYNGHDGIGVTIYATNNDYIIVRGGKYGSGGQSGNSSDNITAGPSNGTNSDNNVLKYGNFSNNIFTISNRNGNDGGQGNNSSIGTPGTVSNFPNADTDPPKLNENASWVSYQNNNAQIDNDNQKAGYGQGGVGGWNSNNTNGYQGQNGGPPLVRVYFLK